MLLRIEHHPDGPRVRTLNQRIHHGAVGIVLTIAGIVLAVDDRHDWRDWFRPGPQQD